MHKVLLFIFTCFYCCNCIASGPQLAGNFAAGSKFQFQENKGQLADEHGNALSDILYYGKDKGISIYCFKDRIAFVFEKHSSVPLSNKLSKVGLTNRVKENKDTVTAARMELQFIRANPQVQTIAHNKQTAYYNYYLPQCPNGITVGSYKSLTYKNIYPNIDLQLNCQDKGLEYSFIVYPEGHVEDIQLQWKGADNIIRKEKIQYANSLGCIVESDLKSYTAQGQAVKTAYATHGTTTSFAVQDYDRTKVLTIDPLLEWATYFGGGSESANAIALDRSENVFIAGSTASYKGIATSGAFQTKENGNLDIFMAKFTSSGSLMWATYFGGYGQDVAYDAAVNGGGELCITGYTNSPTVMASSGIYQSGLSGSTDAFIAKFSSSGARVWSGYFGGDQVDHAYGITIDRSDNIYIAGSTESSSSIASGGAYQTAFAGNKDAFLAGFSSTGKLLWSTYFGGELYEEALSICHDISDDLIIAGNTESTNNIATTGAFLTSKASKTGENAFIAKFSHSGSLLWSTYYGGEANDAVLGVVSDPSDNIIVTGTTTSTKGIATAGSFRSTYGGSTYQWEGDAFVSKFSASGDLIWGSYYGAGGIDVGNRIALGDSGSVFIVGTTTSSSGIDNQHRLNGIGPDAFIARFASNGNRTWGTYFGGNFSDQAASIAVVPLKSVYITGGTSSTDIATSGAYQTSINISNNNGSAFIARFKYYDNDAGIFSVTSPAHNTCPGTQPVKVKLVNYGIETLNTVTINWSVNKVLQLPYNWKGTLYGGASSEVNLGNYHFVPGIDTIKAWTESPNGLKDSVPENDTFTEAMIVNKPPKISVGKDRSICKGDSVMIGEQLEKENTYSWTSKPAGFSATKSQVTIRPTVTTTYYLTKTESITGCSNTDSVTITVIPPPIVKTGKASTICPGQSAVIGDSTIKHYSYSWSSKPAGFTASISSATVKPDSTTTYYLTVTNDSTGCRNIDSIVIAVAKPYIIGRRNVCIGENSLFITARHSGSSYKWTSHNGNISAGSDKDSAYFSWARTGTDTVIVSESNTAGCVHLNKFVVVIHSTPDAGWTAMQDSKTFTYTADDTAKTHTYKWILGDGAQDTGHKVIHTYKHDSTYRVTLLVTGAYDCIQDRDSAIKVLTDTFSSEFWYKIYPNPFVDQATIKYNLPDDERVQAVLYDARGRLIMQLIDQQQARGIHYFKLNGPANSLGAAVYYLRMIYGSRVIVAPVIRIGD
jgi:hypothetical protein